MNLGDATWKRYVVICTEWGCEVMFILGCLGSEKKSDNQIVLKVREICASASLSTAASVGFPEKGKPIQRH